MKSIVIFLPIEIAAVTFSSSTNLRVSPSWAILIADWSVLNISPLTSTTPPSVTRALSLAPVLISSSLLTSVTSFASPLTVTTTSSAPLEYAITVALLSSVTVTLLVATFKLITFDVFSATKCPASIRT